MNQELALKTLSAIMSWPDERARSEFEWLRFMARLKYDGYRDFQAGMRFIESLATWLQQFSTGEREVAYSFVRRALVYIGPAEMQRLVEQFYPRIVRPRIFHRAASEFNIPPYQMLVSSDACAAVEKLRQQTLFMGLSDGARLDIVRHSNVGILSNEQFVLAAQVDSDKWQDLLDALRDRVEDTSRKARFKLVYLIDDFVGTGTSFLRFNESKRKWSGKLDRFKKSLEAATDQLGESPVDEDWELCVHHYVGTFAAREKLDQRLLEAKNFFDVPGWAKHTHLSYGTTLPSDLPLDKRSSEFSDFLNLTQKYYDESLRTPHTDVGGVEHLGLGYGGCALPVVLDHNTPNNSIALLWAETNGGGVHGNHSMRPLFRRRQRHT